MNVLKEKFVRLLKKLIRIEQRFIDRLVPVEAKPVAKISVTKARHDDAYYSQLAKEMRQNVKRGAQPGFEEIIKCTPVKPQQHILDIGIGTGLATEYFVARGLQVTATGTHTHLYDRAEQLCNENQVQLLECFVEDLAFTNDCFDAVWMSHVLEHSINTGVALKEVWRVLKRDGWLFIIVPRYKPQIVGGHLITGWNVGQLMYVLLLNGFNVKEGHFAEIQHNICAFVRKTSATLPELHGDYGDLEALTNYWPVDMKQGVDGNFTSINWDQLAQD